MDVRRLKMNELNKELQHRTPDTSCIKVDLAEWLQAALKAEDPNDGRELEALDEQGRPSKATRCHGQYYHAEPLL